MWRKVTQTVLFVPAKSLIIYTSVDPVLPMECAQVLYIEVAPSTLIYTVHDDPRGLSWTSKTYEGQMSTLCIYIFKLTFLSFLIKFSELVGLYF